MESSKVSFNVYSVIIYPLKNEVMILDDICPDENLPSVYKLDDFYLALGNFNPLT